MRYRYRAREATGRQVSGDLEAPSQARAVETLLAQGLSPVRVRPVPDGRLARLTYADVARMSAELAGLVGAGVPLESGSTMVADAQDSKAARRVLRRGAGRLADGDGPGKAFGDLPGAPGRALSAIMAAGERSGRLADALLAAAPLFAATARFRDKIVSLLLYPAIVSVTALGVLIVFLLVVIPSLRPVLEGLGDAIPASAAMLLTVSDAAPDVLAAMLVAILAGIVAGQWPQLRHRMARLRDRILLSPAGFGLVGGIDTALFARLFAAVLKAGTPAGDALGEAAAAVSNSVLREKLEHAAERVRGGETLGPALTAALGERSLIVQASRLGDRSGRFADLVAQAGLTLAERAEVRLERLAALAGPLIILALGGLIGALVIALFSSLTSLPDAAIR